MAFRWSLQGKFSVLICAVKLQQIAKFTSARNNDEFATSMPRIVVFKVSSKRMKLRGSMAWGTGCRFSSREDMPSMPSIFACQSDIERTAGLSTVMAHGLQLTDLPAAEKARASARPPKRRSLSLYTNQMATAVESGPGSVKAGDTPDQDTPLPLQEQERKDVALAAADGFTASNESVLGITSASAPSTRRPRPHNCGTRPSSTPPSPAAVLSHSCKPSLPTRTRSLSDGGDDDKNGTEADLALPFDLASGAPSSSTAPTSKRSSRTSRHCRV
ncbi:hypothetical protein R3P38DRAFT_3252073 [Favolaschia claudopus]|uniref:Uncharacterized protein n=1 Tax=Favolaschia claudopus TaxID=2862362 RepID=A0AAW0E7P9_9AGAR